MQERVYHDRKYDTVDQLKQAIVLEWRALPRHFIDRLMETSFAVDPNGGHAKHTIH